MRPEDVWREVENRVKAAVRSSGLAGQDAESAVAIAREKVILRHVEEIEDLHAWAATIARNAATDVRRELAKRRAHEVPYDDHRDERGTRETRDGILEDREARERAASIYQIVAEELIPEIAEIEQRTILTLAFVDRRSTREIAAELNMRYGAVRSGLFQGLRTLQILIHERTRSSPTFREALEAVGYEDPGP